MSRGDENKQTFVMQTWQTFILECISCLQPTETGQVETRHNILPRVQHWSSVSQQKYELGLQLWVERWYEIKKYRSTKHLLLPCRSIFAAFSLLHFDLSTVDLHLKMKLPFSWMKYIFTQEFFWCLFLSLFAWGIKLFILIYFLLGLNWCKDKKFSNSIQFCWQNWPNEVADKMRTNRHPLYFIALFGAALRRIDLLVADGSMDFASRSK